MWRPGSPSAKIVGDYKTGKGIYNEYSYQLSAYWGAIEEDHEQYDGGAIFHFNKEDGSFKVIEVSREEHAKNFPTFLHCLGIKRREKLFGSAANAPTNIAGFVVCLLVILCVVVLLFPSKMPADAFLKLILPVIILVLGYLFGKKTCSRCKQGSQSWINGPLILRQGSHFGRAKAGSQIKNMRHKQWCSAYRLPHTRNKGSVLQESPCVAPLRRMRLACAAPSVPNRRRSSTQAEPCHDLHLGSAGGIDLALGRNRKVQQEEYHISERRGLCCRG